MDQTMVAHASTGIPRSPTAKKVENMLEPTGALLAIIGATLLLSARTLNLINF